MAKLPILGIVARQADRWEGSATDLEDAAMPNDFARIFPTHVDAFSRLLIALRAEVGGDLDMVLILAVIGERHFARRNCSSGPIDETSVSTETVPGPSINTYSLAQYTQIPRETVRRKVAALIERGWVVCDARGNLGPTKLVVSDLAKGTDAALRFIEMTAPAGRS